MQALPFRLLTLLIGLALSSIGFAQSPMVQVAKFSIEQGLSDRTVTTLTKDKQGFLWIGTAQGLNRFDGYGFLTYNSRPRNKHQIRYNKI